MKLLYSPTSPYARKVRVVATEKRIEVEMLKVVLADPDCPVVDYNPLGKIPVLILDDGESLFDSRVIVEYLDNRTPLTKLIPQENSAKIWVRRWEALADVALGCMLGWLDLRYQNLNWRETYPNLARHFEELMKRPSFSETAPPAN